MTDDAIENLRESVRDDPLSRRWVRRALTCVAVFGLAMTLATVGVLVWRLSVVTAYATEQDRAAADAQAAYQELFEQCSLADDCDPSGLPTPEEVEDASPTPNDVATPLAPLEPVVIEERLSPAEVAAVGDEAIARYCAGAGDPCVGEGGAPAPPTDPAVIAGAIVDYCSTGACQPSAELVVGAVLTVCADGACVGPAGATGSQGEPGRGPTADEVLAAVAAVCANGACVGPAGGQGVQGASVVGSVCEGAPSTLRFLIFDPATGATAVSDSGAACVPATVPEPEPEPTPDPTPPPEATDVPALPIP